MGLIYYQPRNIVTVPNLFLCRFYVVVEFLHFVSIYVQKALVRIIIFPLIKLVSLYRRWASMESFCSLLRVLLIITAVMKPVNEQYREFEFQNSFSKTFNFITIISSLFPKYYFQRNFSDNIALHLFSFESF